MSLFKIAWRSIQQRGLASALTGLSMALGVMLIVAVLAISGLIEKSFQSNASLGYNMIVGAKGGKLQLTLNTVYYLSQPVENVPYDFFLEFFSAEKRDAELQRARQPDRYERGRDGKYAQFTQYAIPVCLGDYFGNFRVVGTSPSFFEDLVYGPQGDQKFVFAEGRNMRLFDEQNGFFEAVIGATAAREKQVRLGDRISSSHGDPEGAGHGEQFTVVGILEPSGTPNDRAVFVNMEGFYLMENHAKPVLDDEGQPIPETPQSQASKTTPLPIEQREVTAILVRTVNPLVGPGLQNSINEGLSAQAVMPVKEIYDLFDVIVTPFQRGLLLITAMICVVSGISILVSIYNSMSERRHEIAVMRALGASRATVMSVILLESVILSLAGGVGGWFAGHALKWAASGRIAASTGVAVRPFDLGPGVDLVQLFGMDTFLGRFVADWFGNWSRMPTEFLLIPALVCLAAIVGLLPAAAAYRTDVAKSLGM